MSEEILNAPTDGILLVDKEKGKTSFDIVKGVRRVLRCKKTGHAGTLDPFATGLLIILLGQGTKLSSHIMGGKKRYLAEIKLGIETDTCDPTGSIINEVPVPDIGAERVSAVMEQFTGIVEQVPPAYSALKVNGQRAYKLARKGIPVELKKRSVTIYSIKIIDINLPLIKIEVTCSSGTYIRSLASDIGRQLGTVAHLQELRRLSSGLFHVDNAMTFTEIESAAGETVFNKIIPLHESLPEMKTIDLDESLTQRIKNGYRPEWEELTGNINFDDEFSGYVKLIHNSCLAAVIEIDRSSKAKSWLKKVKVFN